MEVWTESRSIAGVIEAACRNYAVSLYPSAGFASLSLVYEAAEYASRVAGGRPLEIIYIGDYDPAGVLIDQSIMGELRAHLDCDITLHRIAITEEQIARYDLPTKPRKKSESRKPEIAETVEAEAIPVELLLRLLRQQLDGFLMEGALEKARELETQTREALLNLADLVSEGEDGLSDVIRSRNLVKIVQRNRQTDPGDDGDDT